MSQSVKTFLCCAEDVKVDAPIQIVLPNRPALAVFKYGDRFYVTDDTCTHADASLAEGEVDGCEIECPFHAGAFDFTTGEPCATPCTVPLGIYTCVVEEDKIYLVE